MSRHALWLSLCALTLFAVVGLTETGDADKPSPPFDLKKRVLWTTSKVIGSPDPAPPYRSRRAFPHLSFNQPVYFTSEPGSDRLLVVELGGRIRAFTNNPEVRASSLFAEVADHDLYSLTFHPAYHKNRLVYVFANGPRSGRGKQNRIFQYRVRDKAPFELEPASKKLIIEWKSDGHNGGDLAFGPDGFLYLSSGDGTSDSDTHLTGQNMSDLTSGIIRIDVDRPEAGKGYRVPEDNPFLKVAGARPELWAYGFRNPWRMSFDRDGNLWVGDVGQDLWEMIHLVRRGGNYGWSVMEGSSPFQPERKRGPHPFLKPIVEHHHSESRSITGGFVYQGERFKDLQGAYIYGDYSTGKIWAFRYEAGKVVGRRKLADTVLQSVAFGQDQKGELYIVDHVGQLYELEPAPPVAARTPFPRKLSDTGLFAFVPTHQVAPGLIPYSVNAALWTDHSHKERFIALPGAAQIDFTENGAWQLPEGTVLVKTFSLDMELGKPATRRRIETRLLTLQQGQWQGYSYRWNSDQTEADLVSASGEDRPLVIKDAKESGIRQQVWHYPSRSECLFCHSRAAGFVLGLQTLQMNKIHDYGGVSQNQLQTLQDLEVFRLPRQDYRRIHRQRTEKKLKPFWTLLAQINGMLPAEVKPVTAAVGSMLQKSYAASWGAWKKGLDTALQGSAAKTVSCLPREPEDYGRLPDPFDEKQPVELRARAYLHANCAICHVAAGGGNSAIDLHFQTARHKTKLIDVPPLHDRFGINNALLVAPGEPERSLLYHRLVKSGRGRMPPLSSSIVDEPAARLIAEWIRELKPGKRGR
jgi:glucose/arabinose dehydrogenase